MKKVEMIDRLRAILDPNESIPKIIFEQACEYLFVKTFPKNALVKPHGETDYFLRIILEGVAVLRKTTSQGADITKWFFVPDDIAFDPFVFVGKSPGNYSIKSRMETTVCMLRKSSEKEMIEKYPSFYYLYMDHFRKCQSKALHQLMELRDLNPGKKYEKLLSYYPNLGNTLTGIDIMGILGISKSTLNLARKRHNPKL